TQNMEKPRTELSSTRTACGKSPVELKKPEPGICGTGDVCVGAGCAVGGIPGIGATCVMTGPVGVSLPVAEWRISPGLPTNTKLSAYRPRQSSVSRVINASPEASLPRLRPCGVQPHRR